MIRRASERQQRNTSTEPDRVFAINDVSWEQYRKVRAALDHVPGLRMTYRDGMLELVSPSQRHEEIKKLIARLVELYALERDVDLYSYGSTTFRRKARKRGCEPDECWTVGARMARYPDLVLEVIVTSSAIDKLDVYAAFGVPELWFWEKSELRVYRLGKRRYVVRPRSELLPELDLGLIESLVNSDLSEPAAVRALRDRLRGQP